LPLIKVNIGKNKMRNQKDSFLNAAFYGRIAIVRELIAAGADVNKPITITGATPLFIAAQEGRIDIVNALIAARNIDVNQAKTTGGATPLYIAAQEGRIDIVKALIAAGADVNQALTADGATPLHIAAELGHTEIVKALIAAGARVNKPLTTTGTTPLFMAAQEGRIDIVKALIAAGADVNQALTTDGATPLHIAAYRGHTDIVNALIAAKDIDVNQARTTTGATPLFIAAQECRIDIVKALIAAGADVNQALTTDGATPLFMAAYKGHADIVNALITAGAKINEQDIESYCISEGIKNILKKAAISQLVSQLLIGTPASIPEEWLKKLATRQKGVFYNMLLEKCGEDIGLLQTAVDNQTLKEIFSPNGGYFLFEKNYMKLLREKISLLSNVDCRVRVDLRSHAQKWQLCGNPKRSSRQQGYSRLGLKHKAKYKAD
jgi:ankyrin repeat protein